MALKTISKNKNMANTSTATDGQPAESLYFHAECGDHFDAYVQETRSKPFEFNQHTGGCTEHTDLWTGRKLRIKMDAEAKAWREAEVVSWDEYLCGPFSSGTRWNVKVRFSQEDIMQQEFDLGDVVTIEGLKSTTVHNGKVACIIRAKDEESERYGVRYSEVSGLGIKSSNLTLRREVEFNVVRCNIQGGGTLQYLNGIRNKNNKRLSFEWLEEAVPEFRAAYEGHLASDAHPINVAKQVNWNDILADAPQPLQEEIRREQQDILGLPAANRMDQSYLQGMTSLLETFDLEEINEDSMKILHTKLALLPLAVWGPPSFARTILTVLDSLTAEIFVLHYDKMKGTEEWEKFVKDLLAESKKYGKGNMRVSGFGSAVEERFESATSPADACHDGIMLMLSEGIAVQYENKGDYYAAIRWYERNIECIPEDLRRHDSVLPSHLRPYATSLNNLALAQKRAGLFTKAQFNYNLAIQYGMEDAKKNLKTLHRELEMWKGTLWEPPKRLDE